MQGLENYRLLLVKSVPGSFWTHIEVFLNKTPKPCSSAIMRNSSQYYLTPVTSYVHWQLFAITNKNNLNGSEQLMLQMVPLNTHKTFNDYCCLKII